MYDVFSGRQQKPQAALVQHEHLRQPRKSSDTPESQGRFTLGAQLAVPPIIGGHARRITMGKRLASGASWRAVG